MLGDGPSGLRKNPNKARQRLTAEGERKIGRVCCFGFKRGDAAGKEMSATGWVAVWLEENCEETAGW